MRRAPLLFAALLVGMTAAAVARGQTTAGNIALDRFEPAPAGDTFFGMPSPTAQGHLVPRGYLLVDYADRPLRIFPNNQETALVAGQAFLRGDASIAIRDRLLLSVQFPFAILQRGDSPDTPGVVLTPPSSAALG